MAGEMLFLALTCTTYWIAWQYGWTRVYTIIDLDGMLVAVGETLHRQLSSNWVIDCERYQLLIYARILLEFKSTLWTPVYSFNVKCLSHSTAL